MRSSRILSRASALVGVLSLAAGASADGRAPRAHRLPHRAPHNVQVGPRPYYLVEDMDEGPLKEQLAQCSELPLRPSQLSIGHRGAALQFPEHTVESLEAGARMGAGILECDVTFTKDRQLVCRHSQCDLHTTTNILTIPALAAKCSEPFSPADPTSGKLASAKCCTSDITLADFKQLCGKMDGANPSAKTPEEYQRGTPGFRTDLYSTCGTLMTHDEYIERVDRMGRGFTPELKEPSVKMPFEGTYTQEQYAQQMIDAYKARGISPRRVFPQSFRYEDVLYWLKREPAFGRQAVYLDGRVDEEGGVDEAIARMKDVAAAGVRIIAPPTWTLVTVDSQNRIVPSAYARAARAAGLDLITWTLERSGPLATSGRKDYYFQSITPAVDNDGDTYTLLDVLVRQVGVRGVFSDWPGTVTYYANCMGRL